MDYLFDAKSIDRDFKRQRIVTRANVVGPPERYLSAEARILLSQDDVGCPVQIRTPSVDALLRMHFRQIPGSRAPAVIWRDFFRAAPSDDRDEVAVCRRLAAQAEQCEAELQIGRRPGKRLKQDRRRWWKLTSFLAFALLPALRISTGKADRSLYLAQRWMETTREFPKLFRKGRGRFGSWEKHGLFMSVGCSAAFCLAGDMSRLFPIESEKTS
ncbi:MAG: hypothetical protein ACODAD_15940 [Planctomycetota bacterium]